MLPGCKQLPHPRHKLSQHRVGVQVLLGVAAAGFVQTGASSTAPGPALRF